jgi:hypothetical protein
MKKFLVLVAISIASVSFGQNNTSKSVLIEKQQKNINNIINTFSNLNELYFDDVIENHFYTQLSKLDYHVSNSAKLTLLKYFSLSNDNLLVFYIDKNGLRENNSFIKLRDSKIKSVIFDTTFTSPNDRLVGYNLMITINYEIDLVTQRLIINFILQDSKIIIIDIAEAEYL